MRWRDVRVLRYAAFKSRVGGTSKAVECKEGWVGVRERVVRSLRVLEEELKVSGRRTREAMLLPSDVEQSRPMQRRRRRLSRSCSLSALSTFNDDVSATFRQSGRSCFLCPFSSFAFFVFSFRFLTSQMTMNDSLSSC
jgi:hypothetical protein